MTEADLSYVTQKVCEESLRYSIPTVEQIQDLVELALIRYGTPLLNLINVIIKAAVVS